MQPQLETVIAEFDAARARLHALERRLPQEAWPRRPSPEEWSPAECVEHLNLTAEAMLPQFRAALETARRLGPVSQARYRRDLVGWLIWRSLQPGGRFKAKTIASFVPTADRSALEIITRFDRLQEDLTEVTRQCDGLPVDRVKIQSPFNQRVRYSLYAALTITATHEHRHLLQAERAAGLAGG